MRKKTVALAILACATMLLVAAAPLAVMADTHHIIKGDGGPRASAVSWSYAPAEHGIWVGHVTNSGLRTLVIEVDDVTTGAPVTIMHQRIRFAAYPSAIVDTNQAIVAKGHTYLITATPNGPKGSSCWVDDIYVIPPDVQASFTFTVDLMTVTVDGSASFDSSGTIVAWGWDWGDGTIGSGATASHTYAAMGLYTIILTVLGSSGFTDSASLSVIADLPPVASFTCTYSPNWYSVQVDASTSSDPDGVIVSYNWGFGDGTTATGVTASHEYTAMGFFGIALVVTDNFGLTSSMTQIVQISPVVIDFTCTVVGLTVTVDASAVSDPYWAIVSYDWSWGDGTTGTGITATHTYAAGGLYLIRLTATFSNGLTFIMTRDVTVPSMPPVTEFTYSVSGFTVAVDGAASTDEHGIVNYVWEWGDGTPTSTGMTATHSYTGWSSGSGPPPFPYTIFGYVNGADGSPLLKGVAKIQDVRTGASMFAEVVEPGFFMTDLNMIPGGFMMGDVINVTIWGGGYVGYNTGVTSIDLPYLWTNVSLSDQFSVPLCGVTITLTVYNTVGESASVSHEITFAVP